MIFSGPVFLYFFLPAVLVGFYAVHRFAGHRKALAFLTLASLVFYSWWDVRFLPLILFSIVFNYAVAKRLKPESSGHLLAFGIAANLGLLGIFKYADFLIGNLNVVLGSDLPLLGIPLPLAISFFTFQQIAFLVDVSRRKTAPGGKLQYGLFVAFFPQLIAGPIVHHTTMAPQFADPTRQQRISRNLAIGFSIFAVGLAKKVLLADNIAPFASTAFDLAASGQDMGFWLAWSGALAYSFQLFFDFSGYSDMAIGLGWMFGFQLPINFNAPYRARSVADFWRRWHITLSHFLRDYLYIPLGGNQKGRPRQMANLAIVMLLGGLWHGAAWTFVIWGGIHGLALIWCHWLSQRWPEGVLSRVPGLNILVTFIFITVAWVFFRAESFDAAWQMLSGMFGLNGWGVSPGDEPFIAIAIGMLIVWTLPDTAAFFAKVTDQEALKDANVKPQKGPRWKASPVQALGLSFIMFFALINIWSVSEFIYYNF